MQACMTAGLVGVMRLLHTLREAHTQHTLTKEHKTSQPLLLSDPPTYVS